MKTKRTNSVMRINFFLNYVFCYILYFFSLVMYLKEKKEIGGRILLFSLIMRILFFLYWILKRKKIVSEEFHLQYIVVQVVIMLFWVGRLIFSSCEGYELVFAVIEGICIILSIFYSLMCVNIKSYIWERMINKEKLLAYIIPIIFFALLALPCIKVSFMWDSEIYVRKISTFNSFFLFSCSNINNLITSHFQLGFDFIYSIFYSIFMQNGNYILFGNIILGGIAALYFAKIICFFCPKIAKFEIGTIIPLVIFSPFVLGMVGCISLDYAMLCFYVCYINASLREKRVYQIFWGILLCFSKEPGILLGAGLVGMLLLYDFFMLIKYDKIDKKGLVIFLKKTIELISPYLIFVILFVSKGSSVWTETNDDRTVHKFGYFSHEYLVEKFKSIFVLNDLWILWLLIFSLMLYLMLKKVHLEHGRELLAISCSMFTYILFNFAYITFPHARYVMAIIVPLDIIVVVLCITLIKKRVIRLIIYGGLSVCLLLQSFFNIDMVSRKIYKSVPTGKGELISTRFFGNYLFSDAEVYNRQYTYCQLALLDFMKDVCYTENDLLIFPDIEYGIREDGARYSLLGLWLDESELYYNVKHNRFDNYVEEGSIMLQTYFYNENSDIFEVLEQYERVFYIDVGIVSDKQGTLVPFLDKIGYDKMEKYRYLSWEITVYTKNIV